MAFAFAPFIIDARVATTLGIDVAPAPATQTPTGGTITTPGDGYTYHTFTSGGTFDPDGNLSVEYLVVGGGAGGGTAAAGGGGGGGEHKTGSTTVSTPQTVTIGAGGPGGITPNQHGTAGSSSAFGAVSAGGGGYGAYNNIGGVAAGGAGGSGYKNTGSASSTGTGGNGGAAGTGTSGAGGGGGGAVGNGVSGSGVTAGAGGAGVEWPTGSGDYYGGGGGGGGNIRDSGSSTAGAGGAGGGTAGKTGAGGNPHADHCAANTGGGGGGGGVTTGSVFGNGGNGGSGVVIVRYAGGTTYQDLLDAQGATASWSFSASRVNADTEPDLIGVLDLAVNNTFTATTGPTADIGAVAVALAAGARSTPTTVEPSADFSFSCFVNMATLTNSVYAPIFTIESSGSNYLLVAHRDDKSGLCVQVAGGGSAKYIAPAVSIENDGLWHHVALTRAYSATAADDILTLYLDGVSIGSASRATIGFTNAVAAAVLNVGRNNAGSYGFNGDIAAPAIAEGVAWSTAQVLAQAEKGGAA